MGKLMLGSIWERFISLPTFFKLFKYFKYTLDNFAKRLKNPVLQKVFPLLHYSAPNFPLFVQLLKKANVAQGGIAWPKGGSATVANNMATRYIQSGGKFVHNKKVVKILTKNGCASGVELEDGTQHYSDFVISNADGRKTITQMLSNRYTNQKNRYVKKP